MTDRQWTGRKEDREDRRKRQTVSQQERQNRG